MTFNLNKYSSRLTWWTNHRMRTIQFPSIRFMKIKICAQSPLVRARMASTRKSPPVRLISEQHFETHLELHTAGMKVNKYLPDPGPRGTLSQVQISLVEFPSVPTFNSWDYRIFVKSPSTKCFCGTVFISSISGSKSYTAS